jgi:hypothetical protein
VSSAPLTILQYAAKATSWTFWPDLLIRLVKTFLASLAASIAAAGIFDVTTFAWSTALNVAVVATLGGLGKGLLAREPKRPAVPAPAGDADTSQGADTSQSAESSRGAESPQGAAVEPSPSTLPSDDYAEATKTP